MTVWSMDDIHGHFVMSSFVPLIFCLKRTGGTFGAEGTGCSEGLLRMPLLEERRERSPLLVSWHRRKLPDPEPGMWSNHFGCPWLPLLKCKFPFGSVGGGGGREMWYLSSLGQVCPLAPSALLGCGAEEQSRKMCMLRGREGRNPIKTRNESA